MEESFNDEKDQFPRLRSIRSKAWDSFSSYSQESTIHSMNYIGKKNLHWIERVFWIVAFLFSFFSCSYLVIKTFDRWQNEPMIVTFKEGSTPAWQIPFPAVTICPESKVDFDKFNLTNALYSLKNNQNVTVEDAARYEALYQVCNFAYNRTKRTNCRVIETLRSIANDFSNTSYVNIAKIPHGFQEIFKEIITSNGVCYTFNMLHHEDFYRKTIIKYLRYPQTEERSNWTIFGYKTNEPFTYPYRVLGSGKEAEMEIVLRMKKKNIDYACKNSANGFRLTLHTPDELPQTTSHFQRVPFNVETLISLEPKVMTTSENLKDYDPKKRQCYFEGEKKLEFFKAYTQLNCKLECFVAFVLKRCGCVRFSMPHRYGTQICNRSQIPCIQQAQTMFVLLELSTEVQENSPEIINHFGDESNETIDDAIFSENSTDSIEDYLDYFDEEHHDSHKDFKTCNCLPSCASIDYNMQISQSVIDIQKHLKANDQLQEDDEDYETAVVSIYFKEDFFIESRRSELYGLANFLSNCGGFLGLLMGGSFLSLIEIIYHLSLRKIFRVKCPEEKNYT